MRNGDLAQVQERVETGVRDLIERALSVSPEQGRTTYDVVRDYAQSVVVGIESMGGAAVGLRQSLASYDARANLRFGNGQSQVGVAGEQVGRFAQATPQRPPHITDEPQRPASTNPNSIVDLNAVKERIEEAVITLLGRAGGVAAVREFASQVISGIESFGGEASRLRRSFSEAERQGSTNAGVSSARTSGVDLAQVQERLEAVVIDALGRSVFSTDANDFAYTTVRALAGDIVRGIESFGGNSGTLRSAMDSIDVAARRKFGTRS